MTIIEERPRRVGLRRCAGIVAVGLAAAVAACGTGNPTDASTSTTPTKTTDKEVAKLKVYDPSVAGGKKPDLPRTVAFASQSDAGFWLDFSRGVKQASAAGGVEFISANANNNPSTNIHQLNSFLQRGVGGLITTPVGGDAAQARVKQQAIDKGIAVASFLLPPATSVITLDQYAFGYGQGQDIADYAKAHMGGKANVAYFNVDQVSPALIPRHKGFEAGLATGGSAVKLVSDEFNAPNASSAAKAMSTILQAHPDIDVIASVDDNALGALRAVQAAGKQSQIKYVSGTDGTPEAIDLVRKGNTPYKVTWGCSYAAVGYEAGSAVAGWLDGKSVPQQIAAKCVKLDSGATIDAFQADNRDPEHADRSKYITLLGNVSYETRANGAGS